jgi:hypothetical protein
MNITSLAQAAETWARQVLKSTEEYPAQLGASPSLV